MEEEQTQKKKGRPRGKKSNAKKGEESPAKEDVEEESTPQTHKGKKCKRGYKFCRNEKCGEMVHIHNKKCPFCGFEFEVKPSSPQEEEDILEIENQSKQSKKIKTNEEEKKDTSQVLDKKAIKKNFYRDTYTINYSLLFEATKNLKERVFPELSLDDKVEYKDPNFERGNPIHLNFSIKNEELINSNLDFNQSASADVKAKRPWKEHIINTGFPINSVAWAYRGKNNVLDKENRTQYFAVAHSFPNMDKLKTDENAFSTLNALGMQTFHKFATRYDGVEYVALYKIEFDEQALDFKPPKLLYYLEHKGGSCMELKWLPINSSSEKEIGVLGILTSNGSISIYNIPTLENKVPADKVVSIPPQLEISQQGIYFTQFAWYPLSPCDRMIVGDLVGNIYLYQIKYVDKKPTASWTKLYQMAHTKDIKDLKWLPYFDDNGEMVFASCSEDGDTKIWTLEDNYTPVYTFSPTKRPLYSLLWDVGMSYLLTNGEGPALSTKILTFQNIKKFLKALKEEEIPEDKNGYETIELKYVTCFETTLKSTSSPFSPYIVSSDLEGNLIYYNSEELRLNFIYGGKKGRNDEIEIVSECSLSKENDQTNFSINYREEKKAPKENQQERNGLADHRVAINALEMNPNSLTEGLKKSDKLVHSMLINGNYLGVLRLAYFYKS